MHDLAKILLVVTVASFARGDITWTCVDTYLCNNDFGGAVNWPVGRQYSTTCPSLLLPGVTWMHGGTPTTGWFPFLSDMWLFNTSAEGLDLPTPNWGYAWTEVNIPGNSGYNSTGVYEATPTQPAFPSARGSAHGWANGTGIFIFGGISWTSGSTPVLNWADVWFFNEAQIVWTWVAGPSTPNTLLVGIAGNVGEFNVSFNPAARSSHVSWIDAVHPDIGWVYGGWLEGLQSSFASTYFGDVWAYNMTSNTWAWFAGAIDGTDHAVYQGPNKTPGPRAACILWKHTSRDDVVYIFGGGIGNDVGSDVWKMSYNVDSTVSWTYLSGCEIGNTSCCETMEDGPSCRSLSTALPNTASPSNSYFFYGGAVPPNGAPLNDAWIFSIEDEDNVHATALPVETALGHGYSLIAPRCRAFHAINTDETLIYMFGGLDSNVPMKLADLWVATVCGDDCLACHALGETPCTTCQSGLTRSDDGDCLNTCSEGTYPNATTTVCEPCSTGCDACSAAGLIYPLQCSTCSEDYYILTLPNGTSVCNATCGAGAFSSGQHCQLCDSGCITCTASGRSVPDQCQLCDLAGGWIEVETDNVTACGRRCPTAYFWGESQGNLPISTCLPCMTGCLNCTSLDDCGSCNRTAGFFWDANSSSCANTCPMQGFYLGMGDDDQFGCHPCTTGCTMCESAGLMFPRPCSQCASFLDARDGMCVTVCPPGTTANETTQICDPDTIDVNVHSGCMDSNCLACSGNHTGDCTQCDAGFVISDGACHACQFWQAQTGNTCLMAWWAYAAIIGVGALLCVVCVGIPVYCFIRTRRRKGESEGEHRPLLSMADGAAWTVTYSRASKTVTASSSMSGSKQLAGHLQFSIDVGTVPVFAKSELTILNKLGQGGFSPVYKVQHVEDFTLMAFKSFGPPSSREKSESLVREASTMISIHHPNCLPCLGVTIDGDDLGMLTEFMPGGDFQDLLDARAPRRTIVDALFKVGQGLTHLHRANLVHADIKPRNILLDGRGGVKIGDFGLTGFKGTGYTPAYAAPELRSRQPPSTASDVFAFATTIVVALVGPNAATQLPLNPTAAAALLQDTRLDTSLSELLVRCVDNDATKRPSCVDILASLRPLIAK